MSQLEVYGIRFKKASRVVDFDGTGVELTHGDLVIVEVEKGLGMGTVVNGPREPLKQGRKIKKVIRRADTTDVERFGFNTEREDEAFRICREKIAKYRLPMKLVSVEYLFDSSKAIFYFTSDTRVDFRGLVKDLASAFHTRIEMRQIGVRDEAKMIGGLGPCGRALCCASFLSDFEPVTIKMAKDQNLALNPVKISGVCGRLMCCLSFEHEAYKKSRGKGGGCHKGGGHQRDGGGGKRHCGAHTGEKAGTQPGTQKDGDRPAGERQGRGGSGRNRPEREGRNRPNRNRSDRNRPSGGNEGQGRNPERSEPSAQTAQAQGSGQTSGQNQDRSRQGKDERQGNRPGSEGRNRPNRSRRSRRNRPNRGGAEGSGTDRKAGGNSSPNRSAEGGQGSAGAKEVKQDRETKPDKGSDNGNDN